MARDRKRAKQRRDRARAGAVSSTSTAAAHAPEQAPDLLEHASADADEARAAVIQGAAAAQAALQPEAETELDGGLEPDGEGMELAPAAQLAGLAPDQAKPGAEEGAGRQRAQASRPRASLASRTVDFLRACWAELQRMQWPNRQQTSQATAVVLGFVIVAGIYLGIADLISQKIVNLIF